MTTFNNESHKLLVAKQLLLGTVLLWLSSCTIIFGGSNQSEIIDLPDLVGSESPFTKGTGEFPVYHTQDHNYLTAIQECGVQPGKQSALTRARELFVGFKMVRLPDYSKKSLAGLNVDRATVLATLDDTQVTAASYIIIGKNECLYDLVLWTQNSEPDQKVRLNELQLSEESLALG